tara:strand:- start:1862 stop:3961 length:2100 start_codon:yes stop_codon:yes gene_type:complete
MALGTSFTQVTKSGLSSTSAFDTGHINSSGIITATKFVGTLEGNVTSDDWTNTATGISTTVNVGIGTTNATSKLTVSGTVTATSFSGTASGNPTLTSGANDRVITATGANAIQGESSFTFDGSTATINGNTTDTPLILTTTSTNGSHMRFQKDGANQHFIGAGGGFALGDKEDLSFRTVDNIIFGVGTSEKVRIKSNGFVGFGTDNPTRFLHVQDGSNTLLALDSTDTNADLVQSDTGGSTRIRSSSGALEFYAGGDASSTNATSSVKNLNITSAGVVQVIKPGSGGNSKLEITQSGGGGGTSEILFSDSVSGRGRIYYDHGSNPEGIKIEAAGTPTVIVTTAGKVGIGIVSPDSLLHLEGSGSTAKIKLQRTGTTIGGSIQTRDGSNDKGLTYIAKDGNSAYPNHVFQTDTGSGGVERLRINKDGEVGIGTADPQTKLHLCDTNAVIRLDQRSNTNQGIEWYSASGSKSATIGWGNGNANLEFKNFRQDSQPLGPYGNIDFYTGNSTNPPLVARMQVTGEVGINTTNPQLKLHVGGSMGCGGWGATAGALWVNGQQYIESADFRLTSGENPSDHQGDDLILTARYNTNTSLISAANTGTGGGTRITFTKACYVLVCMSQDARGDTDSGYWSVTLRRDNSIIGYHLMRKTTHWDMFTFQQATYVGANSYLTINWNGTSGWTNADSSSWSHYTFLVWQRT